MANQSTVGFGFRAANRLGGTPAIQGQTKYQLQTAPGVALMKNDPASIQDAVIQVSFRTRLLLLLMMAEQVERLTTTQVTLS